MKSFTFILILGSWLLILPSCKQPYPDIPKDVIALDEMKMILADMHIADALAETKAQGGMDEKLLSTEYYEQIFLNHKITREQFRKSYKFYEANPALLNKLYDDVLTEVSRREGQLK